MPGLEHTLDSLRPADPGALPAPVVAALRTTRRKRRAAVAAAIAGALTPVLALVFILSRSPLVILSPTITESHLSTSSLAALTRLNRDADPDRLILPALPVSYSGSSQRTGPLGDPSALSLN